MIPDSLRRRGAVLWLGVVVVAAVVFVSTPLSDWFFGRFKERCETQVVQDQGPDGRPIQREAVVCTRGRTKSISYVR